jgi:hypothetical protein
MALTTAEVTAVSRNSGTRRIREDTQGNDQGANQVQEDTGGSAGILKDTTPLSLHQTQGSSPLRIRDREAPGSNPGAPTIFVFEIDDFQCGLQSVARRRITIPCRATKPGRCNGVCRYQCEISRLGIVGQAASQAGGRTGQDREAAPLQATGKVLALIRWLSRARPGPAPACLEGLVRREVMAAGQYNFLLRRKRGVF